MLCCAALFSSISAYVNNIKCKCEAYMHCLKLIICEANIHMMFEGGEKEKKSRKKKVTREHRKGKKKERKCAMIFFF